MKLTTAALYKVEQRLFSQLSEIQEEKLKFLYSLIQNDDETFSLVKKTLVTIPVSLKQSLEKQISELEELQSIHNPITKSEIKPINLAGAAVTFNALVITFSSDASQIFIDKCPDLKNPLSLTGLCIFAVNQNNLDISALPVELQEKINPSQSIVKFQRLS